MCFVFALHDTIAEYCFNFLKMNLFSRLTIFENFSKLYSCFELNSKFTYNSKKNHKESILQITTLCLKLELIKKTFTSKTSIY